LKLWFLILPIVAFSVLWLDLLRQLSYTWDTREQYAYGWFVPFFALFLLWRRWQDRPGRAVRQCDSTTVRQCDGTTVRRSNGRTGFLLSAFIFLLCLLLLPLRVIHEINADWPLITWPYTLIVVSLTLYAFHLAGPQSRDFRFPLSAFPVGFILVAIAWPYRIENGITQGLMQVVAGLTTEILGVFNIAAIQKGNLIEVSTGVVGIDEACSGIRSLQSTVMAGLFMGELYRLGLGARVGLFVTGLCLAFCFNVVRTLLLTWQAAREFTDGGFINGHSDKRVASALALKRTRSYPVRRFESRHTGARPVPSVGLAPYPIPPLPHAPFPPDFPAQRPRGGDGDRRALAICSDFPSVQTTGSRADPKSLLMRHQPLGPRRLRRVAPRLSPWSARNYPPRGGP